MKNLTLNRLKNTSFKCLYKKLIAEENLTENEKFKLLQLALVFYNSSDKDIKELGYRIIVIFSNRYNFYQPLYEIAVNDGLYPIAKFIEIKLLNNNLTTELNSIFLEKYSYGNNILTNQQTKLNDFYDRNQSESIVVIAPTSYGKSELILNSVKNSENKNIVIITPSKALLNQTKNRILKAKISWLKKIVVFPEMYSKKDKNIVAVLTQERLLRLLKNNPELYFDVVIVDEAHDLLLEDDRNLMLASCLIVLQKRNKNTIYKFLTPFISKSSNLKLRYTKYQIKDFKISEHVKTEKYYIYDTKNHTGLKIYDQFMNDIYDIDFDKSLSYIDFIKKVSKEKNIIYFNRPYDIENFANEFCEQLDDINDVELDKAILNLSSYLDINYNLIKCIKKGVIYHHGSIPDNVRIYIEILYKNNRNIKYVITSSTLLEGVNIPASQIFIMDNRKGSGNLKPSDFKNLIGRVCRFGDIFNNSNVDLKKLEPNIYLVINEKYKENANVTNFLENTSKIDKKIEDESLNVLLENTEINTTNKNKLAQSEEFIENYEKGTIENYNKRLATTEIGKSCFLNNITEIDVFDKEIQLQNLVNICKNSNIIISDTNILFKALYKFFFTNVIENKYDKLTRFKYEETRNFYKMFLDWKIKNATYKEMISCFVNYWEGLKNFNIGDPVIYVGSKWGEITRNGYRKLWVNLKTKNHLEIINLAIVKIKEEQDFLEHTIVKFIEVLNDMQLLDKKFYNRIKYGTDDENIIFLMERGFSFYLSKEIINNFFKYISIDDKSGNYEISDKIIIKMQEEDVNDILIFELQQFI